ncbi:MAG: hypothetical protein JXE06_07485 [Coriobacteriia bacterium]|nr:hypothetical protein [Coriobacteriia bacterium]MBN2822349.1 hypothetical protein [Coriobacteriia bacterium]
MPAEKVVSPEWVVVASAGDANGSVSAATANSKNTASVAALRVFCDVFTLGIVPTLFPSLSHWRRMPAKS